MGILGPLSQSVGSVTGASVKGRPTLRRKSSGGVNPRTEAQQEKRSAFAEASEYCRENRDAIIAQEHFKEKKGVTIWNQMMSWYMAGGRLAPTGPYLSSVNLGDVDYDWIRNWDLMPESDKAYLNIPWDLIAPAGTYRALVRFKASWVGEDVVTANSSYTQYADSLTHHTSWQSNDPNYNYALNKVGCYNVYQFVFYDTSSNVLDEHYYVFLAGDGNGHYSDEVPALTMAEYVNELSQYGRLEYISGRPMVVSGDMVNPADKNNSYALTNTIWNICGGQGHLGTQDNLWDPSLGWQSRGYSVVYTYESGQRSIKADWMDSAQNPVIFWLYRYGCRKTYPGAGIPGAIWPLYVLYENDAYDFAFCEGVDRASQYVQDHPGSKVTSLKWTGNTLQVEMNLGFATSETSEFEPSSFGGWSDWFHYAATSYRRVTSCTIGQHNISDCSMKLDANSASKSPVLKLGNGQSWAYYDGQEATFRWNDYFGAPGVSTSYELYLEWTLKAQCLYE